MNVLIVNGYVRQNKGDAALMSVLTHELNRVYKDKNRPVEIKISSREDMEQFPTFEEWENVGAFHYYCFDPKVSKMVHAMRLLQVACTNYCWPFMPRAIRRGLLQLKFVPRGLYPQLVAFEKADLVVSMGGGYLNAADSFMATLSLWLMLMPIRLGTRLKKVVICAPQSMGKFSTRTQERMVARTLRPVDLILTRETITIDILRKLGIIKQVVKSVDSGFLFDTTQKVNLRDELHLPKDQLLVGVTVRKWLDPAKQLKYERAVAGAVDHLIATHHAHVVFIPQVTSPLGGDDDRLTGESVYKHVEHKKDVTLMAEDYDHHYAKALYENLDIIIGTRFHSIIFALTSFVPALAIEYEHKASGIMKDLGLEEWVVKIEDAEAALLIHKVDKILQEWKGYVAHLHHVLPAYIEAARAATDKMTHTYDVSTK